MFSHPDDFPCNSGVYRLWLGKYHYVGSSVDFHARFYAHRSTLRRGCHSGRKIQRVWDAGERDLLFDVVEPVTRHKDEPWDDFVDRVREAETKWLCCEYNLPFCVNDSRYLYGQSSGEESKKRWKDPEFREKTIREIRRGHQKRKEAGTPRKKCSEEEKKRRRDERRKKGLAQGRRCRFWLNGEQMDFCSVAHAAEGLGVDKRTLREWLRGRSRWPGEGKWTKSKHLLGLKGRYLDDLTL